MTAHRKPLEPRPATTGQRDDRQAGALTVPSCGQPEPSRWFGTPDSQHRNGGCQHCQQFVIDAIARERARQEER